MAQPQQSNHILGKLPPTGAYQPSDLRALYYTGVATLPAVDTLFDAATAADISDDENQALLNLHTRAAKELGEAFVANAQHHIQELADPKSAESRKVQNARGGLLDGVLHKSRAHHLAEILATFVGEQVCSQQAFPVFFTRDAGLLGTSYEAIASMTHRQGQSTANQPKATPDKNPTSAPALTLDDEAGYLNLTRANFGESNYCWVKYTILALARSPQATTPDTFIATLGQLLRNPSLVGRPELPPDLTPKKKEEAQALLDAFSPKSLASAIANLEATLKTSGLAQKSSLIFIDSAFGTFPLLVQAIVNSCPEFLHAQTAGLVVESRTSKVLPQLNQKEWQDEVLKWLKAKAHLTDLLDKGSNLAAKVESLFAHPYKNCPETGQMLPVAPADQLKAHSHQLAFVAASAKYYSLRKLLARDLETAGVPPQPAATASQEVLKSITGAIATEDPQTGINRVVLSAPRLKKPWFWPEWSSRVNMMEAPRTLVKGIQEDLKAQYPNFDGFSQETWLKLNGLIRSKERMIALLYPWDLNPKLGIAAAIAGAALAASLLFNAMGPTHQAVQAVTPQAGAPAAGPMVAPPIVAAPAQAAHFTKHERIAIEAAMGTVNPKTFDFRLKDGTVVSGPDRWFEISETGRGNAHRDIRSDNDALRLAMHELGPKPDFDKLIGLDDAEGHAIDAARIREFRREYSRTWARNFQ